MRLGELAERLGCRLEGDGGIEIDRGALSGRRGAERTSPLSPRLGTCPDWKPRGRRPSCWPSRCRLTQSARLAHVQSVPGPGARARPILPAAAGRSGDPSRRRWCRRTPACMARPASGRCASSPREPRLARGTILDAQVFVGGNVRVGRDCRLFPQVTLREGTELGDRVVVHSGTVIGADGFGYARDGVRYVKIPQIGRVVLEDDVEIGANVAIDRATLGTTRIGRGTKIDNLVQIAHNVQVGEDTVIVAPGGDFGKFPHRVARDDCRAGRGDRPRPGWRQRRRRRAGRRKQGRARRRDRAGCAGGSSPGVQTPTRRHGAPSATGQDAPGHGSAPARPGSPPGSLTAW